MAPQSRSWLGARPEYSSGSARPRPRWTTRARSIELAIPRVRRGSSFPDWLLEPRQRAERALFSVVAEAFIRSGRLTSPDWASRLAAFPTYQQPGCIWPLTAAGRTGTRRRRGASLRLFVAHDAAPVAFHPALRRGQRLEAAMTPVQLAG